MTWVASGLVDHVSEDPAKIDWCGPERRDRCDLVERVASGDGSVASSARRRTELDNAAIGVTAFWALPGKIADLVLSH